MKVKSPFKRVITLTVALICLSSFLPSAFIGVPVYGAAKAAYTKEELTAYAKGIVAWKTSMDGLPENTDLVSASLRVHSGTTESDWFVLAMSKLGFPADYGRYLSALKHTVQSRYQSDSKLSAAKATEWHRITLAVLACGGDPTAIGENINLIADGTYNRGLTKPLENQGNNGPVYALIALDSMNYSIPSDAYESRAAILQKILNSQLADGGFAQSGPVSDVDMTAMALTAVAPYAGQYPDVIDRAISFLSQKQTSNGGFSSGGVENAESTAQVIIALTSLGIDPQTDVRFIKQERSAVAALMAYVAENGGVRHTADSTENDMAAQQTLCALAALVMQMNGQGGLYSFTSATPRVQSDDKIDASSPPEATEEDIDPKSSPEKGAIGAIEQGVATQGGINAESTTGSKSEPDPSGLNVSKGGVAFILAAFSALCFFLGFNMHRGRKRDRLFLLGLALALAAVFSLANPETVEAHYNKAGSQNTGKTVTLSINCATIYDHLDDLDKSLENSPYLPESGVILAETEYVIESGDTVFDVLSLAVLENHIQMDYEGESENTYGTVYVTGLQYLYEFSCGELSGWTYAVNGAFPDVGCSSYPLAEGDVIQWLYTCDLGRDVGNLRTEDLQ